MKLKDLPNEEKPRERLLKYGASNISNEDLISILIRTGSKNLNVKEVSSKILSKIKNISSLNDLTVRELMEIKGVGQTKALTLIAAIELGKRVSTISIEDRVILNNTETVHKYFSPLISHLKQENLLVILLDNKKRLISYQNMFKGTSTASVVSVKEIFNYAIKERAEALIIMHNHPSGVIIPSEADKELTNNLILSGKLMGIPLLDHLITNGVEYYSFFDEMVKNEA
jgi:DNA repair protein RadC